MCGIIGAVAKRDIVNFLLDGLQKLEYRGYDSAGLAIIDQNQKLQRVRCLGKVIELKKKVSETSLSGNSGIAHTRWATHGEPADRNAHPHLSENIAVVHNGIIENHEVLRQQLSSKGYKFSSETDTEVISHLIHYTMKQNSQYSLREAVQHAVSLLKGAYGIAVINADTPDCFVVARSGSPMVIGLGENENFVASDQLALLSVTRRFIFLEEGDVAEITCQQVEIFDQQRQPVQRDSIESDIESSSVDKGFHQHYMQKEIYEQPIAIKNTLKDRLSKNKIDFSAELTVQQIEILKKVEHIQIIACGTSYHSGLVSRYWFESLAGIACDVEIASEFRYRQSVVRKNSLFITLSQSGETADTLSALKLAKGKGYLASLTICNVFGSSLVRESDMTLFTKAGVEIGVASTKAFTTQLTVLLMLVAFFSRFRQANNKQIEEDIVKALQILPNRIEHLLTLDKTISSLAEDFANKYHALFLGRGEHYPIAMEGALKLKEISYIHAEAYAAGELKHGPLALIDKNMPVIVTVPNDKLVEKIKSNIEEVRARGGLLYIFADNEIKFIGEKDCHIIPLPYVEPITAPIFYTIPLQLLSYYVALIKGNDVDQPRNLAKSVTVE